MGIEPLQLNYYYGTEAESFSFYRIPKILFTDKRFAEVSVDAKVLYGLMLDRMGLSMRNGWHDEHNRVFIYFTLEDAIEMLGCGHTKATKLIAELDVQKGIGLIERKKQGQGKPTIIYVKSFSSLAMESESSQNTEVLTSEKQQSENEKERVSTDKNSDINDKAVSNNTKNNEKIHNNSDFKENSSNEIDLQQKNIQNNQKTEVLTTEKQKSRLLKNGSLDFTKTDTNNTNINNTKANENKSINQSKEVEKNENERKDGLIDFSVKPLNLSLEELNEIVIEEMLHEQTLPYEYISDIDKITSAIQVLTEYSQYKHNAEKYSEGELDFNVVNLFTEALIEMLTTKSNMTLKGSTVTYAKVYDKLVTFIDFSGDTPSIFNLLEVTKRDFIIACEQFEIKNYLQYMKSCIWNAMQIRDIDAHAFIKRINSGERDYSYADN